MHTLSLDDIKLKLMLRPIQIGDDICVSQDTWSEWCEVVSLPTLTDIYPHMIVETKYGPFHIGLTWIMDW